MKFTQNTSIITPNTIGNVQTRAPRDTMAYGTAGKDSEAWVGAMGQIAKVANKMQDDIDAADHMDRRNKIMTSITKRLYGEDGVLITGVGEKAKGLTERVQQVVREEFENGMEGANGRVRRSMAGTFNENMGNYLRIASQQEGREYTKLKENNYVAGLALDGDRITANYTDRTIVDSTVNDAMRLISARAADQGWSGQQIELEKRNRMTALLGGAVENAIANNDYEGADIILNDHGHLMSQGAVMKYKTAINKESNIRSLREVAQKAYELYPNDPEARDKYIYNVLGAEMENVGGGGGAYFTDAALNDEIMAAADKYKVDPALVAAVADVESNGNQSAVSSVGALGVMQLMPDTAASLGVDPNDRRQNIEGGAKYLRQMLDAFGGDVRKALAAYNAGPQAVKDYGGVPPFKETQDYVNKILGEDGNGGTYAKYKKAKAAGGGVQAYKMPTQGGNIDAQVDNLQDKWKHGVMDWVGGVVKNVFNYTNPTISSAARSSSHNAEVSSSGDKSWHVHNDALDVVFDEGQNLTQEQKDKLVKYFNDTGMFEEVLYHNYGSGWHLHLGGLKNAQPPAGGSGGGRTKRKYSMQQLDTISRFANSMAADHTRSVEARKKQEMESVESSIMNAGSAEQAANIVEQVRANSTNPQLISRAESVAGIKWGLSYRKGGSSGGGSRGGSRSGANGWVENVDGYTGASGQRVSMKQYNEDQETIRLYNEHKELQDQGLFKITPEEQSRANKAAERSTDVWNGNFNVNALAVTRETYNRNKGDFYSTMRDLQEKYGMEQDEAARYIRRYVELQSNGEEE